MGLVTNQPVMPAGKGNREAQDHVFSPCVEAGVFEGC